MNRSALDIIPNWGVSAFRAIPVSCRPLSESSVTQELVNKLWDLSSLQPDLEVARNALGAVFEARLKCLKGSPVGVFLNSDDVIAVLAHFDVLACLPQGEEE